MSDPTVEPADLPVSTSRISLSTTSVYPESTASGFELASRLGYDGIELMVGIDPVAADADAVEKLRDYHEVPVLSVHAPCLLVTQRTWGRDPWDKLRRSGEVADRLGASTVVVHPPFRWQRDYGRHFVEGIKRLDAQYEATFAVENMYPWRLRHLGDFLAYLPRFDPTDLPHEHLTLDLSHASTARQQSRQLAAAWGKRLHHVHFTDGNGSFADEHLFPGEGDQQAFELLDDLRAAGFGGDICFEVNSRRAGSRARREAVLGELLMKVRERLGQPVGERTRDAVEAAQARVDTVDAPLNGGGSWADGPGKLPR